MMKQNHYKKTNKDEITLLVIVIVLLFINVIYNEYVVIEYFTLILNNNH